MTYQFLKEDGFPTQEATILGALWEAQTSVAVWVEGSEILWKADASRVLHEFAIWCAEEALKTVERPDPRSLEAVRVKKLWVDGEATDEELKRASDAAWYATWDTAWYASQDTAGEAAWHAASKAAWATAKGAAWEAARFAANAAARCAAKGAAWCVSHAREADKTEQNKELERRLNALMSPPTAKRKSRWEALLDEDSV